MFGVSFLVRQNFDVIEQSVMTCRSQVRRRCADVFQVSMFSKPNRKMTFRFFLSPFFLKGTLKFVNGSFLTNGSMIDAAVSLKKARRILKKLQNRDFSKVRILAIRGEASSRKVLVTANGLKKQAELIEKRAAEFLNGFTDIVSALESLSRESNRTKQVSQNATMMIDLARQIGWKVKICLLQR